MTGFIEDRKDILIDDDEANLCTGENSRNDSTIKLQKVESGLNKNENEFTG